MNKKLSCPLLLFAAGIIFWPQTTFAADLSLADAIDMALSKNTSLRITQKDETKAEAALREAKGNKGVSVTASDNLSTAKNKNSKRQDTNGINISAALPVYSGGRYEAAIDSSEIGVKSSLLTTERERENLKLDVIKAYYDALEARKTIDVDKESVENYEAHYSDVEKLYSAGSKARVDVLRSSVELSNARQTLIKAQNSYEVNLATLRNLINIDRDEPLTLTDDFSYEKFSLGMTGCIDYAFANRKDILIDEYTIRQKELSVDMAKAGYLPNVNLNVGANQSSEFHPSSDSSHGVSAGVGVSWNVFDSGVTKAEVDAAKADLDAAILTLKRDRENIDLAVRQAYYNMREAEKRFDSTSDAVGQAEEDYFIAREKYRAGEGVMLDIIDAQLALSTAKLNYISAQYDYARYKAELENAMGISLSDTEFLAAKKLPQDTSDITRETPKTQKSAAAPKAAETAEEIAAAGAK